MQLRESFAILSIYYQFPNSRPIISPHHFLSSHHKFTLVLMRDLFLLRLLLLILISSAAAQIPVNVGVILDLGSSTGKICRTSINMALADFYASHPNSTTNLRLHFRDSDSDPVTAASAAVDLISNDRVTAILGPQSSSSASFVADIGAKCHVPVVTFSATCTSVSHSQSPYFVRAAVADSASAPPIAALMQHFGWRRVVPIYEDSDFGASFVPFLVDALDAVGSQVPYRVAVPVSDTDDRILAELYRLKTMQTRVFVVHATSALAARIFANANTAGLMEDGFAWFVTDGVTGSIGSFSPLEVLDSMQGVVGVKPRMEKSEKLKEFKRRWRTQFLKENPNSEIVAVSTFGIWAYDAVFALATAAEAARPINPGPSKANRSSSSTDLSRLPVLETGKRFLSSILTTEFIGLAGKFRLQDGELNVSAFRIVNIIGENGHAIGFWTPRRGLTQRLDGAEKETAAVLGPVIWPPGTTTGVPRGFVPPSNGEKMKIAVPGRPLPGFQAFLNVWTDPSTNETMASGYVIEVFEAAVRRLPYALPFKYVSTMDAKGPSKRTYDWVVQQVPQQFDAVVGDVTITANRSNFVDFTMPYTISGVSMVVPLRDDRRGSAWIFLKPLKADLWLVSALFFVFTGAVVWLLEHRVNEDFRGPPSHQAGTVFYFIFSTLVFSHKEAIVSNLTRIVVIVWVFVVLILSSSYTANLTSFLTVRRVQPTVSDIQALLNSDENVGYLQNSFVSGFLTNMGFHDSRLKPYKSPQQYADALSRGSRYGGVGAVVDELPYLKVFMKDYCANYTITGHPNKTGGFGFVFPKGSSIVPDLSRAILNLTESDEMNEIERRWFGDQTSCSDENSPFSSDSLNFINFWGLFLITGSASVMCLFINVVTFWYKNRDSVNNIASNKSLRLRTKSIAIARLYDEKDQSSYAVRRESAARLRSMPAGGMDPTASPSVNISVESPVSTSHHHVFEDGSASVELASPMAETPFASPMAGSPLHIGITTSNA